MRPIFFIICIFITACTDEQANIQNSVFVAAGITGFMGFILGSIPADGPDRGARFDFPRAVVWGAAASSLAGGLALWSTTKQLSPEMGLLITVSFLLIFSQISPALWSKKICNNLPNGIHKLDGKTKKARFDAAKYLFNHLVFQDASVPSYYASRSKKEFRYGQSGMPLTDLIILKESITEAGYDTFDILVILVHELPNEPDQPAVVVIRGYEEVTQTKVEEDGVIVPCSQQKILAKTIAGAAAFAWR